MITLSFLKHLSENGFGNLAITGGESGANLFYQKLTLDKEGIYITDIGDPVARGSRDSQSYELLVRGKTDIDGKYKLSNIRKYIKNNYSNICELPATTIQIEGSNIEIPAYKNVSLSIPSTITNVGLDAQNRIIYSMTGTIIYKEN